MESNGYMTSAWIKSHRGIGFEKLIALSRGPNPIVRCKTVDRGKDSEEVFVFNDDDVCRYIEDLPVRFFRERQEGLEND